MSSRLDPARLSALPVWSGLAAAALAAADQPDNDPLETPLRVALQFLGAAFPQPTATRCRALNQVANVFLCTSTAEERRVLAEPMRMLALSVLASVELASPTPDRSDRARTRLPYRED